MTSCSGKGDDRNNPIGSSLPSESSNSEDSIELDTPSEKNITEHTSTMPFSSKSFAGAYYKDITSSLRQAGFTNIELDAIEDLSSRSDIEDGAIESISIADTEDFQAGDNYPSNSKIVVTYHSIRKINPPLSSQELQALDYKYIGSCFENAGFVNVIVQENFDRDPDQFAKEYENEVSIDGEPFFDRFDSIPFDAHISIVCHKPYEKYTLQVQLNCIQNLLFSKYDIDISLDGVKQSTLPHGSAAEYTFRVIKGSHTLAFSQKDNSSVNSSVTIDDISTDINTSYKLYCRNSAIDVETIYEDRDIALAENEVKILASKSDFMFANYKDVESILIESGFKNIKYDILYDIVWGWTAEGEVKDVTINGFSDFTYGNVFPSDAEVIITYHMPEDDDPSNISMPSDNTAYIGKDYLEVEQAFRDLGFSNVNFGKSTTSDNSHYTGEVYSVKVDYESFHQGNSYKPTDRVQIQYYVVETPVETDIPVESGMPSEAEPASVSYSTNNKSTVKNGNAGIYSYKSKGGSYSIYYIIDFDEGYVYYLIDEESACMRVKIGSGDLNSVLIITYQDKDTEWSEGLHFKWKNQPDHLIVQDEDGFEWDFYTTNLEDALSLKDSKTIKDY